MNAAQAISTLKNAEADLRARGVSHAALFGSVSRGDNGAESDIDILVEFDPAAHVTLFDYAGLKSHVASLFDVPVDVVDRDALKPHLRQSVMRDIVYAF